jgi:hypothetical protein
VGVPQEKNEAGEWVETRRTPPHKRTLSLDAGNTDDPVKFSLHYLYFDFPSEEGAAHQKEIEKFSMLVGAQGYRIKTHEFSMM